MGNTLRDLLEQIAIYAAWFIRVSLGINPIPLQRFVQEENEYIRANSEEALLDLMAGYTAFLLNNSRLGLIQRGNIAALTADRG